MENSGICRLSLIPVRKEPSERSEMVTQVMYGETFAILDSKNKWSLIRSHFDNYQGWVTTKMLKSINAEELNSFRQGQHAILKQPVAYASSIGQYLPGGSIFELKDLCREKSIEIHDSGSKIDIPGTARKFLNTPYLWGGRSVFGMDCSGLTQVVCKMNGIFIPRDACQQAERGTIVDSVSNARPGDLAFFHDDKGEIIHTGIILENSEIIHSLGTVHIDTIDNIGIFSKTFNVYTHRLTLIKRIHQHP